MMFSVLATNDDEAGPCEAESAAAEVGEVMQSKAELAETQLDETQRAAELDAEAGGESWPDTSRIRLRPDEV